MISNKYKDLNIIGKASDKNIVPKLRQNKKIYDLLNDNLPFELKTEVHKRYNKPNTFNDLDMTNYNGTVVSSSFNNITPSKNITPFKRPSTPDEFKKFHTDNEIGIKKAYASDTNYFIDDNKLYIAGTKTAGDVWDYGKLVSGNYKNSSIYKNVDEVIKNNPNINTVIGHSAGGSAALEIEKNYNTMGRTIDSVTYNAPVYSPWSAEQYIDKTKTPMRFALAFDPITLLDMNATTTFHAPDLNFDLVKDAAAMIAEPNFDTGLAVVKQIAKTDPLMGLHQVNTSYSEPSSVMDFINVASGVIATASSIGII